MLAKAELRVYVRLELQRFHPGTSCAFERFRVERLALVFLVQELQSLNPFPFELCLPTPPPPPATPKLKCQNSRCAPIHADSKV